jgi:hypothetical protein
MMRASNPPPTLENTMSKNVADRRNLKSSYATRKTGSVSEKELKLIQVEVKGLRGFSGGSVASLDIQRAKAQLTHPSEYVRTKAKRVLDHYGVKH